MITRKVTYHGNFDPSAISALVDLARKAELTGQVTTPSPNAVVLNLEGDPSYLKLLQHQIERKLKTIITGKDVEKLPYQYYVGLTFLP